MHCWVRAVRRPIATIESTSQRGARLEESARVVKRSLRSRSAREKRASSPPRVHPRLDCPRFLPAHVGPLGHMAPYGAAARWRAARLPPASSRGPGRAARGRGGRALAGRPPPEDARRVDVHAVRGGEHGRRGAARRSASQRPGATGEGPLPSGATPTSASSCRRARRTVMPPSASSRRCSIRCGTRGYPSVTRSWTPTTSSRWRRTTWPPRLRSSTSAPSPGSARWHPLSWTGPSRGSSTGARWRPSSGGWRRRRRRGTRRFGGSVYLLEPDVKSGAGGLRDLDGARWALARGFRWART